MSTDHNPIEIHHTSIAHGENLVLKSVDFTVCLAEFIYLIGKTGSGKSSLLKAMSANLKVEEGDGPICG